MATRTSQSSPRFLREADASAASSASKMISLSTPFSLETASTTIRISLFIDAMIVLAYALALVLRLQPGPLNQPERQGEGLPIHFNRNPLVIDRSQRARVTPPAVQRACQLHVHPAAEVPLVVRPLAQDPIEPRRGHLQVVLPRNRVARVEGRLDFPAHRGAVVQVDPLRAVDEQAQHRLPALRYELDFDQFVTQRLDHRLQEPEQLISHFNRRRKQKWAQGPIHV